MNLVNFPEMQGKSHLIFDFDETLVHLLLPWDRALDPIKERLIALDSDIFDAYERESITLSELQNRYVEKFGREVRDLLRNTLVEFESTQLQGVRKNDELIAFVKRDTEHELFLWSSNTTPIVTKVLEECGIREKFKKIVTRLDVDFLKPHGEGFLKIYDPAIPKSRYLLIGDSTNDEKAAQNSGIGFYEVQYFQ